MLPLPILDGAERISVKLTWANWRVLSFGHCNSRASACNGTLWCISTVTLLRLGNRDSMSKIWEIMTGRDKGTFSVAACASCCSELLIRIYPFWVKMWALRTLSRCFWEREERERKRGERHVKRTMLYPNRLQWFTGEKLTGNFRRASRAGTASSLLKSKDNCRKVLGISMLFLPLFLLLLRVLIKLLVLPKLFILTWDMQRMDMCVLYKKIFMSTKSSWITHKFLHFWFEFVLW